MLKLSSLQWRPDEAVLSAETKAVLERRQAGDQTQISASTAIDSQQQVCLSSELNGNVLNAGLKLLLILPAHATSISAALQTDTYLGTADQPAA